MDGLEWKRSKYSPKVQTFLKHAEKWAVLSSDELVSDSIGIQDYIRQKYAKDSTFIPYGADVFKNADEQLLQKWNLNKYGYYILVARMVPENNIDMILEGYNQSTSDLPFMVVGKLSTPFATKMKEKYGNNDQIRFVGGIYDQDELSCIRYFSKIYFHGHSVGGTNPSLLEAMGSSALIAAHNNIFNESILGADAFYFSNANEVTQLIKQVEEFSSREIYVRNNLKKITAQYSWEKIINQYEQLMIKSLS